MKRNAKGVILIYRPFRFPLQCFPIPGGQFLLLFGRSAARSHGADQVQSRGRNQKGLESLFNIAIPSNTTVLQDVSHDSNEPPLQLDQLNASGWPDVASSLDFLAGGLCVTPAGDLLEWSGNKEGGRLLPGRRS